MSEGIGNKFIDEKLEFDIGLITYKMTMKKAQLDEEIVAGLNIKISCL